MEPSTAAEKAIAQIWSELLGVARVGARDNFFDLGGHSLLATRFVSRLRDMFGVELPLRKLFEESTLAHLAAAVERADAAAGSPLPPIEPLPRLSGRQDEA